MQHRLEIALIEDKVNKFQINTFNSLSGGLETKADTLPEAVSTFPWPLPLTRFLRAKEINFLLDKVKKLKQSEDIICKMLT